MNEGNKTSLDTVAAIVSAYVSNNSVASSDLPSLIENVHQALLNVASGGAPEAQAEPPTPAVSIKKSITPDHLICLDDGKKFKSLKRHLRTHYDMSPQAYREKWGLPSDYPMVAPSYAQTRSDLAKKLGLGHGRKQADAAPAVEADRKPGRKKAVVAA
jgi:predicted transcriptional regulator